MDLPRVDRTSPNDDGDGRTLESPIEHGNWQLEVVVRHHLDGPCQWVYRSIEDLAVEFELSEVTGDLVSPGGSKRKYIEFKLLSTFPFFFIGVNP